MALTPAELQQIIDELAANDYDLAPNTWPEIKDIFDAWRNARSGTPTVVTAVPADMFLYVDKTDDTIKTCTVQDLVAAVQLNAHVVGETTGDITASPTATALPIFTTLTYSSTPTGITKSTDDTGLTLNVPVRYKVGCNITIKAGGQTDFFWSLWVDETRITREVEMAGDGTGRARTFPISAFTPVITPGAKLTLRVRDSGDTLTYVAADMSVEFAGT